MLNLTTFSLSKYQNLFRILQLDLFNYFLETKIQFIKWY